MDHSKLISMAVEVTNRVKDGTITSGEDFARSIVGEMCSLSEEKQQVYVDQISPLMTAFWEIRDVHLKISILEDENVKLDEQSGSKKMTEIKTHCETLAELIRLVFASKDEIFDIFGGRSRNSNLAFVRSAIETYTKKFQAILDDFNTLYDQMKKLNEELLYP